MTLIKSLKRLSLLLLIGLYSCMSITEEIFLNEDGSGEYMIYTDMIGATKTMMMEMMMGMNPDASEDSIRQVVENQIWQQFPNEVDSILDFNSKVPDSIKNDPDKQKFLVKMEMFMKGGREQGFLNQGLKYSFSDLEDLEAFHAFVEENQGPGGGQAMNIPNTKVDYSFDGKSFTRKMMMENQVEMDDSLSLSLNSLLEGAKWRVVLHFPKKIKKASKDQLQEKDGKDVVYEFELINIMEGDGSAEITVNF